MTHKRWRTIAIILIILILVLSFITYKNRTGTYEFDGFKLRKSTIDDIRDNYSNSFLLCKPNKENCISFTGLSSNY